MLIGNLDYGNWHLESENKNPASAIALCNILRRGFCRSMKFV